MIYLCCQLIVQKIHPVIADNARNGVGGFVEPNVQIRHEFAQSIVQSFAIFSDDKSRLQKSSVASPAENQPCWRFQYFELSELSAVRDLKSPE